MNDSTPTQLPSTPLATQDWTLKEMMDTERRIEKAFHEQTVHLNAKFETQTRWMIGLLFTVILAVIVAIFFQ